LPPALAPLTGAVTEVLPAVPDLGVLPDLIDPVVKTVAGVVSDIPLPTVPPLPNLPAPPLPPVPPLPPLPTATVPAPPAGTGGGQGAVAPVAASPATPAAAQPARLDRAVPERARVGNQPVGQPSVVVGPPAALAAPARSGSAAAARAVGTLGFSLLVAVGVLVFLAVQGWIDRRDPHLARAPIDADDDVLGFA
jgi:hypothetical protein